MTVVLICIIWFMLGCAGFTIIETEERATYGKPGSVNYVWAALLGPLLLLIAAAAEVKKED